MMTALPTGRPAYGLEGPSAGHTVDNATPQGSTYLRGNSVQSNGAGFHISSMAIAEASPPPMQSAATPRFSPRRLRA